MTAFLCPQCSRALVLDCCAACGGTFTPRPALDTVFAQWELLLAAEIRSGALHKGTVLAALMILRDCVRAKDPQLAELLVAAECEAAEAKGGA